MSMAIPPQKDFLYSSTWTKQVDGAFIDILIREKGRYSRRHNRVSAQALFSALAQLNEAYDLDLVWADVLGRYNILKERFFTFKWLSWNLNLLTGISKPMWFLQCKNPGANIFQVTCWISLTFFVLFSFRNLAMNMDICPMYHDVNSLSRFIVMNFRHTTRRETRTSTSYVFFSTRQKVKMTTIQGGTQLKLCGL